MCCSLRPQSGAIMAVLASVCTKMPEAKLAIIFLPMFTFTAANVSLSTPVCPTASSSSTVMLCSKIHSKMILYKHTFLNHVKHIQL